MRCATRTMPFTLHQKNGEGVGLQPRYRLLLPRAPSRTRERAFAVALAAAGIPVRYSGPMTPRRAEHLLKRTGAFTLRVLKGFRANQGYLLASAVAYNTLLSILPLLILMLIVLTNFVDEHGLMDTLGRYVDLVVPGQADAIMDGLRLFLEHRNLIGWVLVATIIFFSSLAFTVLENAMSVIFFHRVAIRRRHFMISALIPFCYIFVLGIGLMLVTFVAGALRAMGQGSIAFLGQVHSLVGISGFLLYLI